MSAAASPVLSWFEIPTADLERAVRFYESALGVTLRREEIGGIPIALFPYTEPATGGALVQHPAQKPSADGVIVYLNAQPGVDAVLARVTKAGGAVQGPVVELPREIGYIGFFIDSEGNRIGLHSCTRG
jgi:predicted enzyme related to lactoylglutathione lyase